MIAIVDGPLVKRLRRCPLTAETGVRFPYGLLFTLLNILKFFFWRKVERPFFFCEKYHNLIEPFFLNRNVLYIACINPEKVCEEWVQTRRYQLCVFYIAIPLRVC